MPADYILTCDGGSRGNGSADSQGYGSWRVEVRNGPTLGPYTREFGRGVTNNEAEYMALIAGLRHVAAYAGPQHTLEVRTDSQLVVGHLTMGWKVNAANLQPLVEEAEALLHRFAAFRIVKTPRTAIVAVLGH